MRGDRMLSLFLRKFFVSGFRTTFEFRNFFGFISKKAALILLIIFAFVFSSFNKGLSQEESKVRQLRMKFEELKRMIQKERQMLSSLNERLRIENKMFLEEYENLAKKVQSSPLEKIDYQADPNLQIQIKTLRQQLLELNQEMTKQKEVILEKDREIKELNQLIDYIYDCLRELVQP